MPLRNDLEINIEALRVELKPELDFTTSSYEGYDKPVVVGDSDDAIRPPKFDWTAFDPSEEVEKFFPKEDQQAHANKYRKKGRVVVVHQKQNKQRFQYRGMAVTTTIVTILIILMTLYGLASIYFPHLLGKFRL